MDWTNDIGTTYLLFLKKENGREEMPFPDFLKDPSTTIVDNYERLVAIEATEDADEKKALYLEIFHTDEDEFFMNACKGAC